MNNSKDPFPVAEDQPTHESGVLPSDSFLDMLPLYLSQKSPEKPEPEFADLPLPVQQKYVQFEQNRAGLEAEGKFAEGSDVVVFVSEIDSGETETNFPGIETPFVTYNYAVSDEERDEHQRAAEGLVHRIGQMTGNSVNVDIRLATMDSLRDAIKDKNIAHIIFIGHANGSTLAVEVDDDFDWDDPDFEIDHLKKSFGVFGCGVKKAGGPFPRVGLNFVAPKGVLYSVPGDFLDEGTPYTFDELVRLPSGPLTGTPTEK